LVNGEWIEHAPVQVPYHRMPGPERRTLNEWMNAAFRHVAGSLVTLLLFEWSTWVH